MEHIAWDVGYILCGYSTNEDYIAGKIMLGGCLTMNCLDNL